MIRSLLIIAGSAFVLCLVALGGAAALGGADIQRHGWAWVIDDRDGTTRVQRGGREVLEAPQTERTVAWSGGDTLTLDLPIDVDFVQGPASVVRITGPSDMVQRVRVEGGRISLDDGPDRAVVAFTGTGIQGWSDSDRVRVTVTAPSVTRFRVMGSSDLVLRDYDQDILGLEIMGSGDVDGRGRAGTVELAISGSGDVDLRDMTITDATVAVSGSGDARLGPTGRADVQLSGSGDVDLTTRPARLTQSVTGSGAVDGG